MGGTNLSATETEGESAKKWGRGGVDSETSLGAGGVDAGVGGSPLPPGMLLRSRLDCLGTF